MIIAKITLAQADRAACLLQAEGGHDEAAEALFAITNDTDALMTSDGAEDAEAERLIKAAAAMLAALKRAEVVCEDAFHDAKAAYEKDNAAAALEAWRMVKAAIAKAEGREG